VSGSKTGLCNFGDAVTDGSTKVCYLKLVIDGEMKEFCYYKDGVVWEVE